VICTTVAKKLCSFDNSEREEERGEKKKTEPNGAQRHRGKLFLSEKEKKKGRCLSVLKTKKPLRASGGRKRREKFVGMRGAPPAGRKEGGVQPLMKRGNSLIARIRIHLQMNKRQGGGGGRETGKRGRWPAREKKRKKSYYIPMGTYLEKVQIRLNDERKDIKKLTSVGGGKERRHHLNPHTSTIPTKRGTRAVLN